MAGQLKREAADEVLETIYAENPERMRRFLSSLAVATNRDGRVPDLAESLIHIYEAMRRPGPRSIPSLPWNKARRKCAFQRLAGPCARIVARNRSNGTNPAQ